MWLSVSSIDFNCVLTVDFKYVYRLYFFLIFIHLELKTKKRAHTHEHFLNHCNVALYGIVISQVHVQYVELVLQVSSSRKRKFVARKTFSVQSVNKTRANYTVRESIRFVLCEIALKLFVTERASERTSRREWARCRKNRRLDGWHSSISNSISINSRESEVVKWLSIWMSKQMNGNDCDEEWDRERKCALRIPPLRQCANSICFIVHVNSNIFRFYYLTL